MLFFDGTSYYKCIFSLHYAHGRVTNTPRSDIIDCNWGDNCGDVTRAYGVVSYRTPNGLQYHEFEAGLKKYRNEAHQLLSSVNRS
jgi:hypothetical protein